MQTRRLDRALDFLGEHTSLLVVVGGLGAAVSAIGLDRSWGTRASLFWSIALAVSLGLPAVGTKRNKLQQGKIAARSSVMKVLRACGVAYGHPARHVRTSIMLACEQGSRRKVDSTTAFNMDGDPDCDLEIDATAGVSGEAFVHRTPAYGDLTVALRPGGPSWGLRDSEKAKVRRDLKSILSVPMFDPDAPDGPLLGTLQVDSDATFQEMEFDKAERREVAERFADVVALLLKVGRS